MGYQKGHYGKYTGNARCCMDHADTKVTKENYKASERDDAAHIDYLKRDVLYDDHHGHSDKKMTADEKHISKLAGDMKYDKEHHGSPAKNVQKVGKDKYASHAELADYPSKDLYNRHMDNHQKNDGSPAQSHFKPVDINKNKKIDAWEVGKAKAMNKHD